ncbi:family 43 glycosylhydrolase [Ligilactobacillus sp. LYQ135]
MSLINELKKYKYMGMPFHSPSWPTPTYSHLIASNDGFNWTNLKDYSFGWRDTDVRYIGGLWWVCFTTSVRYTTDFETFTEIPFKHPQFNSVWAPELFKDNDGQWYLIYCGGDGTDNSWSIYVNKFYPDEKRLDDTVTKVNINENEHWIDANLNYINGYYYLWLCCTSRDPHELRLYKSSSLLGTYERVQTNITDRVKEAGMVIDEAPEMLYRDGRYILYSDPYYHGLPELDRCVQYSISKDMTNWSSLAKVSCTGNYNPRHFTPYYIGDINLDNSNVDSGNSNATLNDISFNLWNGDPNIFYKINLDNFTVIQSFINNWNGLSKVNDLYEPIGVTLDITDYGEVNRNAYGQFIDNAEKINSFIVLYCNNYRINDDEFVIIKPTIPYDTDFNKDSINKYWQDLQQDFNFLIKQAKANGVVEDI